MSKVSKLITLCCLSAMICRCSSDDPLQPEERKPNEVWIQNSQFIPFSLAVSSGTTAIWTNRDGIDHTLKSGAPMNPTAEFNLKTLGPGESADHNFSTIGSYPYFCSIHGETGRIEVSIQASY